MYFSQRWEITSRATLFLPMGAKVTVQVTMGDGTPVAGARIRGVNHDAWSQKHREWAGTSDPTGKHTWESIDTGTLGDRCTFQAEYVDPKGMKWTGQASERIRNGMEIVLTLAKGGASGGTPE